MRAGPAVSIQGLAKRYGETQVLSDVSLDVQAGEVVVVIGPSGAGKSTLLRCVNGLTSFERGRIDVLGQHLVGTETAEFSGRARRHALGQVRTRVGMVFQAFNLFPHLTVLDNITLAPIETRRQDKQAAMASARQLLERVGLADKAQAYPRRLSGGQQQRVAICRALAMNPDLMLFDEVTSALDPELVGEVLSVMRDLASEGMTMIVVTHEMAFARDVGDSIVVMADGMVVEMGEPQKVLAEPSHERTQAFLRRFIGTSAT